MTNDDGLPARFIEAFLAPRRSMRRGLEEGWSIGGHLLMVAAGAAVQAIILRLGIAAGQGGMPQAMFESTGPIGFYLMLGLAGFMQYAVFGGALWAVGGAFGGAGGARDCFAAVAWWTVVSAVLGPLALLPGLLAATASLASLWMLAGFAAEVHGFESHGKTMAILVTLMMLAGAAMLMMLGGLAVAP